MTSQAIRTFVVGRSGLERRGLLSFLGEAAGFRVVGDAAALLAVPPIDFDLLIVDDGDGVEALHAFLADRPGLRCLGLVADVAAAGSLLQAGVDGVLLTQTALEELPGAVGEVMAGRVYLPESTLSPVLRSLALGEPEGAHDQGAPLLATKLHRPRVPEDRVSRERLVDALELAVTRPLTLVSAPAGFGKSVLVSDWVGSSSMPSCWLSLDAADSDLRTFLRYLIAGLRNLDSACCESTERLLGRLTLPGLEHLCTTLSNDLEALPDRVVLVLDDYHRLSTESPVHELLNALLERPPLTLHLVILTRRDPPLALLARRAAGDLHELRMNELAFSPEETAAAVARIAGTEPLGEAARQWYEEIEGWPIGVRLLALALRSAGKRQLRFELARHQGGTRDYLLGELLGSLDEQTRRWLLESSVLDRFCAPLCAAVSGELTDDGVSAEAMLSSFRELGLPLVELDVEGRWFRHHHAFQQLLLARLEELHGADRAATLRRRASAWFAEQDLVAEAVSHALAARDEALAVQTLTARLRGQLGRQRWQLVRDWLALLPDEVLNGHLELLAARGWVLIEAHRFQDLIGVLDKVERLTSTPEDTALRADIQAFRGAVDVLNGKYASGVAQLKAASEEFLARQPDGVAALSVTGVTMGLTLANQPLEAIDFAKRAVAGAGPYAAQFAALAVPASLMHAYLSAGEHAALRTLMGRDATGSEVFLGLGTYRLACSQLATWEPAAAQQSFSVVVEHLHRLRAQAAADSLAGCVLLHELQGRREESDRAFAQLEALVSGLQGDWAPLLLSVSAHRSLLRGDVDSALTWARAERSGWANLDLLAFTERPAMTRARALIAGGERRDLALALGLLDELEAQAGAVHCHGVDLAVLRAQCLFAQGHPDRALASLGAALDEASTKGTALPFLETGPGMRELLSQLAELPGYEFAKRALVLHSELEARRLRASTQVTGPGPTAVTGEPLTRRERDILELLGERLQNKEIAARLFVSVETVKTHLKHLYQKLGVSNRREAARIAQTLDGPQAVDADG